jgi:hypothetical protein
MDEDRMCGM